MSGDERELTSRDRRKLEIAAGIAGSYFPYLIGIFGKLDIRFDDRVSTIAVTEAGKLLLNRQFFNTLEPGAETAFLLAHEMLHLAQMTFERGRGFPDRESVNIAHDLLINEQLCDAMRLSEPPRGGLSWEWFTRQGYCAYNDVDVYFHKIPDVPVVPEKASAYSLEELVRIIASVKGTDSYPSGCSWDGSATDKLGVNDAGESFSNSPFAQLSADCESSSADSGGGGEPGERIVLDMISEELERSLFPDEKPEEREKSRGIMLDACRTAAARNVIFSLASMNGSGMGEHSGGAEQAVDIVRSFYVPPWQMAMQRWFDGVVVPGRSYARASRRGAWRSDVVLPGRENPCYMLHIILDTSGSMEEVIPYLLGQIGAFARNVGMEQVHILQCDGEVTADEIVDIGSLEKYRISGYGGSDMSPAMLKLADDPDVTSVLVITDGYIIHPRRENIPYDVLWCLPEADSQRTPFPYGRAIYIPVPVPERS